MLCSGGQSATAIRSCVTILTMNALSPPLHAPLSQTNTPYLRKLDVGYGHIYHLFLAKVYDPV